MPDNKTVTFDASRARIAAFLDARTRRRGLDPEVIHGLDGEYDLLVSDLQALLAAAPTPAAQSAGLKDHEIRELVNTLRDTALQYRGAQQLRARIASIVTPLFKAQSAGQEAGIDADGWEWVRVKNLQPLLDALERAERKGYLPDAFESEWEALEIDHAAPVNGGERDAALEEAARLIETTNETVTIEGAGDTIRHLTPRKTNDAHNLTGRTWAEAIRALKSKRAADAQQVGETQPPDTQYEPFGEDGPDSAGFKGPRPWIGVSSVHRTVDNNSLQIERALTELVDKIIGDIDSDDILTLAKRESTTLDSRAALTSPAKVGDVRSDVIAAISGVWDRGTNIDDAADEVIDICSKVRANTREQLGGEGPGRDETVERFMLCCHIDGMDQFREFVLSEDFDRRVHDLETLCDPQFLVQDNWSLKDQIDLLTRDNQRLRAALSADGGEEKRDAERYRWLRNEVHSQEIQAALREGIYELDEAIDAAIAANQTGKGE